METVADGFPRGRGALDNKQALLGILEAGRKAPGRGILPERGIDLAFGCDEEVGGEEGAAQIAEKLRAAGRSLNHPRRRAGRSWKRVVRIGPARGPDAGTCGKGYASLDLSVPVGGRTLLLPPKQTAIGILARAVQPPPRIISSRAHLGSRPWTCFAPSARRCRS